MSEILTPSKLRRTPEWIGCDGPPPEETRTRFNVVPYDLSIGVDTLCTSHLEPDTSVKIKVKTRGVALYPPSTNKFEPNAILTVILTTSNITVSKRTQKVSAALFHDPQSGRRNDVALMR
jgi:hypothetical protein